MNLAVDLTPTQKLDRDRRRAFHAYIEEAARKLSAPKPTPVPKPEPVVIWPVIPFEPESPPELIILGPIAKIQSTVCKYYGNLSVRDMKSEDRTRAVVRPRQIAIWLARRLSNHSTTQLGNFFGGRDHATVLHAVRVITKLIREDENIAFDVAHLLIEITGEAQ